MKHASVGFALLLSSLTLAAQSNARTDTPVLVLHGIPVGNGCPIGMHASQGVWDHTLKVRQGQQEQTFQPFGQRILLSLVDTHPAPIATAAVKVIGMNGKNRMLQTAADNEADAVKIVNVTFAKGQDNAVSGDLYIPGFTSVSSVELLQVSYSDGKTWKIGSSSVCRVTPDRLMLVATH